jgi:hypothetical protein
MADNLHSVYMSGEMLGVHCIACEHRAVLTDKELGNLRSNMKRLVDLKLRCARCGVSGTGTKDFALYTPHDLLEKEHFLRGLDLENRRRQ